MMAFIRNFRILDFGLNLYDCELGEIHIMLSALDVLS
jgi:hypothetical protein